MVKTGDDGIFTLNKLIAGDLNVIAFAGNDAASAPVSKTPGELLRLTLQPRPRPNRATWLRLTRYWPQWLPRKKRFVRCSARLDAGACDAKVETDDRPRAEELWQTSETTLRGMTPGERGASLSETVMAMAITGALASKLNKPSAKTWPTFIANVIETQYPTDPGMRDGIKQSVLVLSAKGTRENYETYAAAATPAIRASALAETSEVAAASDLKTALAKLDQIEALPDEKAKAGDENDYGYNDKNQVFGRAALALLPRLVRKNPEQALALARRIPDAQQKALALAASGQKAGARNALFQEAFDATREFGQSGAARIAALAFEADPVFGKTLFDQLLAALEANQDEGAGNYYRTPEIAFYVARTDSATARRLLERTFAAQKASVEPGMEWQVEQTVRAMAAVDLNRALEMSRSLSNDDQRFQTQIALANYALASQAERGAVSFEEFGNGSWRPGQAAAEGGTKATE